MLLCLLALAAGLIVTGTAMVAPPAAWITAGLILAVGAFVALADEKTS